jgi:D-3-phosphoglycerate dehydrogenase / 2-oxoglutarate reductase
MFDVLTLNAISPRGLSRFSGDRYRVGTDHTAPDAILVRSFNLHGREIPASLKAVGRAGAGVNNIPVAAMSERGIPVFNAPGANANAVKELVIGGMILACRRLCPAWEFARTLDGDDSQVDRAVEAGKKAFAGRELAGRTVAIIGLGAIGRTVANAAAALGMHAVGYDPGLTVEGASQLSSAVVRVDRLDESIAQADFVTLHVPLVDSTRGLINADRIAKMTPTTILLNFARQAIVDESAVVAALDEGRLDRYVSDFPVNLTRRHPKCVTLPHLGASTEEAEENCAIMVADQVREFLEHGNIRNSVNFPDISLPRTTAHRVVCASESLPQLQAQISSLCKEAGVSVSGSATLSRGDVAYTIVDLDAAPPTDAAARLAATPGVRMVRMI